MKSKIKKPTKAGPTKRLVCDGLVSPSGADLIRAERIRQIVVEGFTAAHDDSHRFGEMAKGAAAYTLAANIGENALIPACWPWTQRWWKPSNNPVHNLIRAGALIAAEIDRLQRKQAGKTGRREDRDFDVDTAHSMAGYPDNR